jgi:hypothetical protein
LSVRLLYAQYKKDKKEHRSTEKRRKRYKRELNNRLLHYDHSNTFSLFLLSLFISILLSFFFFLFSSLFYFFYFHFIPFSFSLFPFPFFFFLYNFPVFFHFPLSFYPFLLSLEADLRALPYSAIAVAGLNQPLAPPKSPSSSPSALPRADVVARGERLRSTRSSAQSGNRMQGRDSSLFSGVPNQDRVCGDKGSGTWFIHRARPHGCE